MRNRDYALTPAVSAILAALIVSSTIGTIIVWGVPYTDSLNSEATRENVVSQMADISNQIKDLTGSSPGDKKASTYAFGGGSISVSDDYDRTVIMYSHDPNYEFTITEINGNDIILRMLKQPSGFNLNEAEVSWSTCFLAGTKVLMADGSYKNIEDVKIGDLVLSYDEVSKGTKEGRVSEAFHHSSAEMPDYYIIINKDLKVTPNHRFYSAGKWVYAGDLKIGDKLYSQDKSDYYIYSLKMVYSKEPCFDLEIEKYHTYFVSMVNDGVDVLVHNPAKDNLPPSKPENPQPSNHATDVPINVILRWSPCTDPEGGKVFYEVYFGPKGALKSNPLQEETWFDPGPLNYNALYWWKVIAYDEQGNFTPGDTWDFTTVVSGNNPPNIPVYSSPPNTGTGVNILPTLRWNCSDPDGDPLTYHIYFGTTNPPALIKSNWPVNSYAMEKLDYGRSYYWRIAAQDDEGLRTEGPVWSFTTQANTPSVQTQSATNITKTTAVLKGKIVNDGGEGCQIRFRYRCKECELPWAYPSDWQGSYNTNSIFQETITGLNPGVDYEYQSGAKNSGGETWGEILYFKTTANATNNPPNMPNNPQPANGATNVDFDINLIFNGGDPNPTDTVIYSLYFGTINPPPFKTSSVVSGSQTTIIMIPGTLNPNTKYYWKITAQDNYGETTTGPIWNFTTTATNNPPNMPNNPNPTNYETDVWVETALSWTGGDPDGDFVTYDFYFGTNSTPPFKWNNANHTTLFPLIGRLEYNTTYYWKIIAIDEHGATTSGPIWSFTTEATKSITVISPNGGEAWRNDTIQNITWFSTGIDGDVKIRLERGELGQMFTVIVPNTGYYMWDIKKSNENGIYPGFYYIRITSEKNPDISDNSDDLFYIYGEGSYIVTMPPESVTYNSAILKGELKNLEGRIRFRYREKDEINWIYPSDWHGEYGNGPFDETVSGLLPSKKYEYQAGVKLWNDVEIWGIGYYFMTILHEGFVNQTTIPKEGISDLGDNTWSIQLPITINGTTVIDLYATIGPCFLAGTKVLMADGSYKKIEDVKIGDFVKSYEEQTGIFVDKKVINVFHHDAEEMTEYYMIINDHLKVTPNHKFYSNGRWALAENLKIGDALFSKAYGDEYTVNSIDYVYKKMPTFDLEIYDCHNYFVSIDEGVDVLVHNENDEIRFGTIWIFDSNSLVYTRTDRGLTDSYVLEKNGIVSYLGGDWFVEQNPQIYSSSNLFSINVVRTLFSFFSISVSHSDMLKFKLYSNLNSSYIGETKKVYNLRLQFEGDYANEWGDYLKQKYSFEDDSVPTDYISLRCINSEYGINLALAHSVVNLRLEP